MRRSLLIASMCCFFLGAMGRIAHAREKEQRNSAAGISQEQAAQWGIEGQQGFVENKGQIKDQEGKSNPRVKYLLHLPGLNVQLRPGGFSYDVWVTGKKKSRSQAPAHLPEEPKPATGILQFHRVDITLEGADLQAPLVAEDALPGVDHIMDGSEEFRDIRRYHKVTYKNIYPGIDLEFVARKGSDKPVEYNFIVHPGADPAQIRMRYDGANAIALKGGMIKMELNHGGTLVEKIPSSFIEQTGERVAVQYKTTGSVDGLYAFHVPDYDCSKTLVIDPTPQLVWSTYLGGAQTAVDAIASVRLDNLGNVIVVGTTDATSGIATIATPITGNAGAYNNALDKAYVVKYTAAGVKTWGVMIGGNADEFAAGLAVDNSNNIYVGLSSLSTTLRTTAGVHQTATGGARDIYVAKLTPAGAYTWGTYLGGTGSENLFVVATASDGNVLVGGTVNTATSNIAFGTGYDLSFGGVLDGFVTKINATTGDGMWGTYVGGTASDWVLGLTDDAAGNVYFVGAVTSTGLATPGAYQAAFAGGVLHDFIIGRLNSTGNTLSWCTYYGGTEDDAAFEVAVDHAGDLVVTGRFASDGKAIGNTYQTANAGGAHDALILKMTNTGVPLWASYYGGPGEEQAHDLEVDENNNIFLYGYTSSTTGIATNCSHQPTFAGGLDCYIAKLSADGTTRLWGSYFGGSDTDRNNNFSNNAGDNFAYAGNGAFYIAGNTQSSGIATGGAADVSLTGSMDGLLARLTEGFAPADVAVTAQTLSPMSQTACALGIPSVITGNLVSIFNPATFSSPVFYQWQVADDSTNGPWTDMPGEVFKDLTPLSGNTTKFYRRRVLVNDGFCDKKVVSTSAVATVTVTANVAPIANANGPQWFLCGSPNTVALNGSGSTSGGATISTYQWYAGSNLTTPVAATANYSPTNITSSTTYTLKVTDNNGCTDVDQVTVTPVVANAGPDRSLCQGSGGTQIGTTGVAGGAVSYSWSILSGTPGSLSCTACAQPIANPAANSTYRLTVTVTRKDNTTCVTTDDVVVSFVATPTNGPAMAGTDKTICKSSSVVLGNGAGDPAATYSWAPANYLSNPNIAAPTFNAGIAMVSCPLTYTVTAIKNGCTFIDQVKVSVINPEVDYQGDTTVCYIFSEPLNEPNCSGASYAWVVSSGPGVVQSTTAGGASATLYNPGATYSLFHRVTTLNGVSCPSQSIIVSPCGSGCPSTQIKVVGDKGCPKAFAGQEFQLYLKGVNPAQWNYFWTPANIMANPNAPIVTIDGTAPATVDVVIVNKITGMVCQTDSLPINDPAWILPTINTPDRLICSNMPSGIGELGGGGYSYEWTPTQGLTNPGLSNPLATLSSGTSLYTVVKTDNVTGCIVTDDVEVTVSEIDYDAGNSRTVCNGATITLGSTPGGNYTYSWDPAGAAWTNGTGPTDAQPQVLFAGSGSQTFTVTVTDTASGCTIVDTVTLSNTVTPGEYTGADVGPICPGTTVQLGKDPEPGASYLWSPATGLSCTTCANPVLTAGTAGQTYTLTVSYPGCSTPVTDQVTVSVHPVPAMVFNDKTVCPSTPTNIGVGGAGGNSAAVAGVATWDWSPATALSCVNCPSPLANPQAVTTYTATATLTNGCIITDDVTITPTVTATAKPDATICPGGSVQLGSPAQAGVTYAWTVQPGGSPIGTLSCTNCAQPVASPTVTTVYRLSASGSGCTVTDDVQIKVKTLPAFTVTGNTSVCAGSTATLSVTPVAQNTIYQWSPVTGVASPNSPVTTIVPTATTTYKVTQTDLNSGCSDFKQVVVSVVPNNVSATGGSIVICPSTQDTLPLNVIPAGNTTIVWSPASGLNSPFVQNPVLTPMSSGSYIATVTDNATNCSDTALVEVTVPASCLGSDYGDAPLAYDAPVPASHGIVGTLKIGTSVDAEGAAVNTVLADGDDLNQVANDEEGISFLPGINTASKTLGISVNSVLNNTGSTAYMVAWIDFNRDGDFNDAGERSSILALNSNAAPANPVLQFNGFNTGCVVNGGPSYLRTRLTTDTSGAWIANPDPGGIRTDGEVEDYAIVIYGADFGDAPVVYPAAKAIVNPDLNNNGAPDSTGSVWLGTTVDYPGCNVVQSATATGDDLDGLDDEDGLNTNGMTIPNSTNNWTVTVNSQGPVAAVKWGMWIDWDADGAFDVFYNDSVNTNSPVAVPLAVPVPAVISPNYIIRLGVKIGAAFGSGDYSYPIVNGEWEDYIGPAVPLNASLLSFTAAKQGRIGMLRWETLSEQNAAHFYVERSADGIQWTRIGKVAAAGSSTIGHRYEFPDDHPLTGINYYRLALVATDGSYKLSPVRRLDFAVEGSVTLVPNPANETTTVLFSEPTATATTLKVRNSVGQVIRQYGIPAGTRQFRLELGNEARGVYLIDIQGAAVQQHLRLVLK